MRVYRINDRQRPKLKCQFIDMIGGSGSSFVSTNEALPKKEALRLVNRWNSRSE